MLPVSDLSYIKPKSGGFNFTEKEVDERQKVKKRKKDSKMYFYLSHSEISTALCNCRGPRHILRYKIKWHIEEKENTQISKIISDDELITEKRSKKTGYY